MLQHTHNKERRIWSAASKSKVRRLVQYLLLRSCAQNHSRNTSQGLQNIPRILKTYILTISRNSRNHRGTNTFDDKLKIWVHSWEGLLSYCQHEIYSFDFVGICILRFYKNFQKLQKMLEPGILPEGTPWVKNRRRVLRTIWKATTNALLFTKSFPNNTFFQKMWT